MSPIGQISQTADQTDTLARGRLRAALIPDCLVEARRVANIVIAGWHGRRKRGTGDNFWQFRQFTQGESVSNIDWRKSARDDQLYVRDKEWETAHTVWLWADLSPSMQFQSEMSEVSKESRSLVILFALAEILSRSGERIGIPGVMDPILARNGAERLAQVLAHNQALNLKSSMPDISNVKRLSDIIIVSDFLGDDEEIISQVAAVAQRGTRGHLVEVSDPAEEIFPYTGRVEFTDPETNARLVAGKASTIAEDYSKAYKNRRVALSDEIRRMGWSYTHHRTDRAASEALAAIHGFLSGLGSSQNGGAI
jgi:uncharacterized protein (DUF58 family)